MTVCKNKLDFFTQRLSFWLFAGCGAGGFGGGAGGAGGGRKASGTPMFLALRGGNCLPIAAAKGLCASVLDPGGKGISRGSSLFSFLRASL